MISSPKPADMVSAYERPSFSVETIHISCKSDAYRGSEYCYAGVIIYSCDGKSQWQTANGTRCKSGYLVIMDTAKEEVKKYQQQSPGQVHGAVYRSAFGEECTAKNINAEGFSVMNGVFKINSGVFNPAKDGYHDDKRSMHPLSASCIQKVVNSWMKSGEHFIHSYCRNFAVQDLLRDTQQAVSPPFVATIVSASITTRRITNTFTPSNSTSIDSECLLQ